MHGSVLTASRVRQIRVKNYKKLLKLQNNHRPEVVLLVSLSSTDVFCRNKVMNFCKEESVESEIGEGAQLEIKTIYNRTEKE